MFDEYYDAKLHKKANPELRFIERVKKNLSDSDCKHIHIIGVCGTAMGTFALMLRDKGFHVSGSDVSFWPPMGPLLQSSGVEILEGWSADHISDAVNLVVVGNACGPTHIEVIAAIEKKKPLMSMPEIMGDFFVNGNSGIENNNTRESLVVAGTHGKTTTSGLLAYTLSAIDCDPTYLIGGVMQTPISKDGLKGKEGTSHHVGNGKYVVFEGDEYDTSFFDARPKFLHYHPSYSIITSVEWDHVDIYESIEEYTKAFEHLIEVTKKGLVVSNTYPLLNKLIGDAKKNGKIQANVLVYGIDGDVDLKPIFKETTPIGQKFELIFKGESFGEYITPMFGEYNVLNTVAVLGLMHQAGIDIREQKVRDAIASFPGMKRRQEVVAEITGENNGRESSENITIIDDFAHHPTAVAETLKGIHIRYPGRRIVALFEPRSSTSRRKTFEHTYPHALAGADIVGIKIPPYKAEVDAGKDLLDPEIVKKETEALGKKVLLAETTVELVDMFINEIQDGDVIVVMSNGAFDGIHNMLAEKLGK